jgi:predicted lipid carrier protein YhbT
MATGEVRCFVATAEECRQALEKLTCRIADMDPADRATHLVDRAVSCHVPDLGVTFWTELGPDGATPVRQANGSDGSAQVRFTARSDDLVELAANPLSFPGAWLSGRLKIEASVFDLLRLRRLL